MRDFIRKCFFVCVLFIFGTQVVRCGMTKKIRKAIRRKQGEGKGGRIDESAGSKKNGEAGRKKNEEKGMKKRRSRNAANFIRSHPSF